MSESRYKKPPNFEEIYTNKLAYFITNTDFAPRSILVTGAQGMLGNGIAVTLANLVQKNLLERCQLILASRKWSTTAANYWSKNKNCKLINNSEIGTADKEVDLVIHTASPSNITKINSFEELNHANLGLLKSIYVLNPKKFVFISSGEVYKGNVKSEEENLGDFLGNSPRDWYPLAKIAAENYLLESAKYANMDISIVRLFHTFGPGVKKDDGRSFADILWGAAEQREIRLKSDGKQIRTFLYLSDAIDAILSLSLSKINATNITNLGSPYQISIIEFAQMVAEVTRARIVFEVQAEFQHSPNQAIIPNLEKLSSYGWSPKVDLYDGIYRTIKWIKT
jgi:nucleoside-diphosphate-sugar epimerase